MNEFGALFFGPSCRTVSS